MSGKPMSKRWAYYSNLSCGMWSCVHYCYFLTKHASLAFVKWDDVLFSFQEEASLDSEAGPPALFPSNIPLRERHQQFTRHRPLTCQSATLEITEETQYPNTARVERGKSSQTAGDITCLFYERKKEKVWASPGKKMDPLIIKSHDGSKIVSLDEAKNSSKVISIDLQRVHKGIGDRKLFP